MLDDRGDGYWIGREVTRIALHSATGAGQRAPAVEDLVFGTFGGGPDTVEAAVHGAPTDRGLLARRAEPAAALDDPQITALLDRAAVHLTALADAVRRRLGPLPVAMTGGIWHIPRVRAAFVRHTAAVPPAHPPEIGALSWPHGRRTAAEGRGGVAGGSAGRRTPAATFPDGRPQQAR